MISKYPGTCAVCGKPYAAGDSIHYNKTAKRGQRGKHTACAAGAPLQPRDPNAPTGPHGPRVANPAVHGPAANLMARFDSLAHFCDWTRSFPLSDPYSLREYREDFLNIENRNLKARDHAMQWYGAPSFDDCMRLIRDGWPEGAARIQEIRDSLDVAPPRSIRRVRVHSDQGDAFDIHRAWAGQFDRAWDRTRRESKSGRRHVTLIASMQGVSGTPAWVYFARGAAVLAVADVLGEAGYDVAIEAEYRVRGWLKGDEGITGNSWASIRIPVKDFRAPADLASLASTVALAGFKRVYGFTALLGLAEMHAETRAVTWASQPVLARSAGEFAGFDSFDTDELNAPYVPHKITEQQATEAAQAVARRIIRAIEQGSDGATIWPATEGHTSEEFNALSYRMDWTGGPPRKEEDKLAA